MKPIPALNHPETTTLDVAALKAYLSGLPGYLKAAEQIGSSPHARDLLNRTDYVDFHFRRYLSGRIQTLHRVFYEIRRFLDLDPEAAPRMIGFALDAIERKLLDNEFFEIMPRYHTARSRINKAFGLIPTGEFERLISALPALPRPQPRPVPAAPKAQTLPPPPRQPLLSLLSETVDKDFVLRLLRYPPAAAPDCAHYNSPLITAIARYEDEVDRLFRRYLLNYPTPPRRLYKTIRAFLTDLPDVAPQSISNSISLLGVTLLKNNLYEIMPRFHYLYAHIRQRFNLPDSPYKTPKDLPQKTRIVRAKTPRSRRR